MINHVVVAGAGTMGAGIAQVFAQGGMRVSLVDVDQKQLERAIQKARDSLQRLAQKGSIAQDTIEATLGRITTLSGFENLDADLFIEAIPENLDLKIDLFRRADAIFPRSTLFASNTSGLSISKMAAALGNSRDLIGLHFFNPVPVMKLLEVVKGEDTSERAIEVAHWIGEKLKKEIIVVKDSPGFATSRLGICIAFEAMRMLESGVASAEDIDKAMVFGYGHPIGPLKLTDLVGLDVRLAIGEHLSQSLGQEQFQPPEILRRLVKEGVLGQKAGRGFYSWAGSTFSV